MPQEIGKLSSLKRLDLSANHITGTIPASLQALQTIKEISFAGNALYGAIPFGMEKLVDLELINLSGNMITGTFPDGLLLLAMKYNLKTIIINSNLITGFLPDKLADCNLNILYLSDNYWYCPIPEYAQWQKIKITDYNSLQTCVQPPPEILDLKLKMPQILV